MKYVGALGLLFAIVFGLVMIDAIDALQVSLLGSVASGLTTIVTSMGFILLLMVTMMIVGGVVAAFSHFKPW